MTFNRRTLLVSGGLALTQGPLTLARGATAGSFANDISSSFPATDPELVSEVVGVAHTDLDRVVELVTAQPHLARASVDWGFGDWESALGAASHMGRRDIAEFLIENGARPNIFSAAMLGQLEVVRALVEAAPGVQRIPGPHGITLLSHARAGGDGAAAVLEYLESLGDADVRPTTIGLSDQERRQLVGTYEFDAPTHNTFEIIEVRGSLSIKRAGREFGRRMFPVSETEFYPAGSPSVRIAFRVDDGKATSFRITDSRVLLTARRVAG